MKRTFLKRSAQLLFVMLLLFQTGDAQTKQSIKMDTLNYSFVTELKSLKLHEGENLVRVIEKVHKFYVLVKNGEITKYYIKEKNGKKYYGSVTSHKTHEILPGLYKGNSGTTCFDAVTIPGVGTVYIYYPCTNS